MNMPPLLRLELAPSHLAAFLIFGASLSTAALLAWLPMPAWVRGASVVATGVYGVWLVRRWAMRTSQRSITTIELGIDRQIALIDHSGIRIEGEVRQDSYVGPLLTTVVMRPRAARYSRSIAILPDMLPREDLRQLRVLLRFGQKPRNDM